MVSRTFWGLVLIFTLVFVAFGFHHAIVKADSELIKGSGNLTKKTIEFEDLRGVALETIGDMYVEYGERAELTIEAEDNYIDRFETEVKRGILYVDLEKDLSIKTTQKVKYYVTLNHINFLAASSAGDIHAPNIKEDELVLKVSSAGDIDLKNVHADILDVSISSAGDVTLLDFVGREFDLNISSAGDFTADRVEADNVDMGLSSSGDARVDFLSCNNLEANVSSAGDVRINDGRADEMDIGLSSSGDFKAGQVKSQKAKVRISSAGDASVYVSGYLDAKTSSSGSVYVYGDPETVDAWSSSGGRVKRMR